MFIIIIIIIIKVKSDVEKRDREISNAKEELENDMFFYFFHKMKSAAEEKTVVLFRDDRYRIAKDLWMKIEKQIPLL
jgi:hypothetical protein